MLCRVCQSPLPPHAQYCTACGAQVDAATGPTTRLDVPVSTPQLPNATSAHTASLRDGVCPLCSSDEIYVDFYGLGEKARLTVNLHAQYDKRAAISTYVCGQCGYIQMFIAHRHEIDELKKTWNRAKKR